MKNTDHKPARERWAWFRFSTVAPLLAAPPARGELHGELTRLAAKTWSHPITEEPTVFGFSTIENWYYRARAERQNPVETLTRKVRDDAGTHPSISAELSAAIRAQHKAHKRWSYQLHYDNLVALAKEDEGLGPIPSYPTIRRFMRHNGLLRVRKAPRRDTEGAQKAAERLEQREVRSYEVEYVGSLWHYDFHESSRPVLTRDGSWVKPQLLGVLDDHSRLGCHVQWYLAEDSENVAHGLSQAFQKRGLPRAIMNDRGGAELARETQNALKTLGILPQPTLPYSPYQNGKQEFLWTLIEGRLLPMLEGEPELTLDLLNEATYALIELEYHRKIHSEIGTSPLRRFLEGKSVLRPSPTSLELRRAFRICVRRKQRRSDGTISVEGVRFEVPSRYRHHIDVWASYARWDLSTVDMIDPDTKKVLATLYPIDKVRNADGVRRQLEHDPGEEVTEPPSSGIAPLLRQLMEEWRATGLPPAYIPKDDSLGSDNEEDLS